MRVQPYELPVRAFRPRPHATLPEPWTKNSLLTLVGGVAHHIGLNATDMVVLRRLAQKTRAPDYTDTSRSPICFERQIDMATSIGLSTEQWRRVERKLERLGLIARATAANGYRGRVSGSLGLESCAGLSLEPLICRLDVLVQIEMRKIETAERLAMCRLEISKARREIKRLERDLVDRSLADEIADERASWVAPRGYATLANGEAHLDGLQVLLERIREIVRSKPKMTGAAVMDDRCHKQNTSETLSESCRTPDGAEDREERKRGTSDADLNEQFISCLSIAKLHDLASSELRLYIEHAPTSGGLRSLTGIEWAVLQRLRDLGIDPSVFEEAMEAMGWLRAMLSVIVIDRNRTHPSRPVRNCGGALRAFTSRYLRGELDLRASIFGIWGRERKLH